MRRRTQMRDVSLKFQVDSHRVELRSFVDVPANVSAKEMIQALFSAVSQYLKATALDDAWDWEPMPGGGFIRVKARKEKV